MSRSRRTWVGALAGLALAATGAQAQGIRGVSNEGLSGKLQNLFGANGIELADVAVGGVLHDAHFTSTSLATLGILVERLSAQAADFPVVSTVPGFTYRYNADLGLFEKATTNLGSVFTERGRTLGAGKLDLGVNYMRVDFDELDGVDLAGLTFRNLSHNDCCAPGAPPPSPAFPAFEQDTAEFRFKRFDLKSQVFSVSGTIGLTDSLDLNVVLPIVYTELDVEAIANLNDESGLDVHFFDTALASKTATRSVDDDAFGIGDVQVRIKHAFVQDETTAFAGGISLRTPTGEEDDFQGLGDWTLTPFVALGEEFGILDVHGSLGLEINFDDTHRSRVRFAGGIALQVSERIALLTDVVGSSNLKTDRIHQRVPQFVNGPGTSSATPGPTSISPTATFSQDVANEIVDIVPGIKVALTDDVIGYFTAFVPVTNDGLRAKFIPSGGIQATF